MRYITCKTFLNWGKESHQYRWTSLHSWLTKCTSLHHKSANESHLQNWVLAKPVVNLPGNVFSAYSVGYSGQLTMCCVASCVASTLLWLGKYDDLGVEGFAAGSLEILPSIGDGGYIDQEPYVLKIKTKFWLREEDFAIEGLNGRKWLKMNIDAVSNKKGETLLACTTILW